MPVVAAVAAVEPVEAVAAVDTFAAVAAVDAFAAVDGTWDVLDEDDEISEVREIVIFCKAASMLATDGDTGSIGDGTDASALFGCFVGTELGLSSILPFRLILLKHLSSK